MTVGRRIASFVQKRDRNDKPSEKARKSSHASYVRATRDNPGPSSAYPTSLLRAAATPALVGRSYSKLLMYILLG